MAEAPHVFMSYSRRDHEFVEQLSFDLRRHGIDVWRDVEQIAPGTRWKDAIRRGVSSADVFLHVVSRNSIESDWINNELNFFLAKDAEIGKSNKVIPILIGDLRDNEVAPELREVQWIDFRSDYESALAKLVSFLQPFGVAPGPIASKHEQTKGYVFISYAEEDTEFVKLLREFLHRYRYSYWDFDESQRNYHTRVSRELEGIIRDAAATLSVLSD